MEWKKLLSYVTGSVDQELLLRNEYLVAETASSAIKFKAVYGLMSWNDEAWPRSAFDSVERLWPKWPPS